MMEEANTVDIVREAFKHIIQVVIGSRQKSEVIEGQVHDYFNLVIPATKLDCLTTWLHNSVYIPVTVNVFLFFHDKELLVEQWKLNFGSLGIDSKKPRKEISGVLHKKFVVILRNIFSVTRILPSNTLSRKGEKLECRVTPVVVGLSESFKDTDLTQTYSFGSINTSEGIFQLDVQYLEKLPTFGDSRVRANSHNVSQPVMIRKTPKNSVETNVPSSAPISIPSNTLEERKRSKTIGTSVPTQRVTNFSSAGIIPDYGNANRSFKPNSLGSYETNERTPNQISSPPVQKPGSGTPSANTPTQLGGTSGMLGSSGIYYGRQTSPVIPLRYCSPPSTSFSPSSPNLLHSGSSYPSSYPPSSLPISTRSQRPTEDDEEAFVMSTPKSSSFTCSVSPFRETPLSRTNSSKYLPPGSGGGSASSGSSGVHRHNFHAYMNRVPGASPDLIGSGNGDFSASSGVPVCAVDKIFEEEDSDTSDEIQFRSTIFSSSYYELPKKVEVDTSMNDFRRMLDAMTLELEPRTEPIKPYVDVVTKLRWPS